MQNKSRQGRSQNPKMLIPQSVLLTLGPRVSSRGPEMVLIKFISVHALNAKIISNVNRSSHFLRFVTFSGKLSLNIIILHSSSIILVVVAGGRGRREPPFPVTLAVHAYSGKRALQFMCLWSGGFKTITVGGEAFSGTPDIHNNKSTDCVAGRRRK